MTRRIAVLDNNPMDSAFVRAFPNDGEKVVAGLAPLRPGWTFEVWAAKHDELPPDATAYDGWVLTGSVSSVNDAQPWIHRLGDLLRELHARRAPMAGLCFGHQMIARALGGGVGPSPGGWRLGVATTRFVAPEPWMRHWQSDIALYAAHQEQVLVPPPGARVLGGDAWAPVGSLALGDHVFTTQYHPELSREFLQGVLREHGDEFPPEVAERARGELRQPVDAPLFLQWLAQFLELPRAGKSPAAAR